MRMTIMKTFIFLTLSLFVVSCGYNDATLRPNVTYIDEEFYRLGSESSVVQKSDGLYYLSSEEEVLISSDVRLVDGGFNKFLGDGVILFEGSKGNQKSIYTYNGSELKENVYYGSVSHFENIDNENYLILYSKDNKTVSIVRTSYGEFETIIRMTSEHVGLDVKKLGDVSRITHFDGSIYIAFTHSILKVTLSNNDYSFIYQDSSKEDITYLTYWNDGLFMISDALKLFKDEQLIGFNQSGIINRIHSKSENFISLSSSNKSYLLDVNGNLKSFSYQGSFIETFFDSSEDLFMITKRNSVFGVYKVSQGNDSPELIKELDENLRPISYDVSDDTLILKYNGNIANGNSQSINISL